MLRSLREGVWPLSDGEWKIEIEEVTEKYPMEDVDFGRIAIVSRQRTIPEKMVSGGRRDAPGHEDLANVRRMAQHDHFFQGTDILSASQDIANPVSLLEGYVKRRDAVHGGRAALFIRENAKTVLILLDRGLRDFSPSSAARSAAVHLEQVVRHSTLALVYLRTSSKPWADGLQKLKRFTSTITLLYMPNHTLRLSAKFASLINERFPLPATRFHLFTPPPSSTLNIVSLS